MAQATASLRPWLTHPRMTSKWLGLVASGALAGIFWHPWSWLAALLGLLWFFPNEYVVHRWVYHRVPVSQEVKGPARNHILHHVDPTDLGHIFNDPRFSVVIGGVNLVAAWGILWLVGFSWAGALGLAGGFAFGNFVGLVYYEYIHFTAHRPGVKPWIPWDRFLKKMHLWHHYKNEHYWFGVTTRSLDKMLGSYRHPDDVEKSETVRSLVPPGDLGRYMD